MKKKRKHIILKILGIAAAVIVAFFVVTSIATITGNNANLKKAENFSPVEYDNQLVPYKAQDGYYTFDTDKELKIVQLTDVHIGGGWLSIKKDAQALNTVAALLSAEKPDLVIVTGDIAYPVPFQSGTINNKNGAKIFAALMEKLGVYWTFTFGNHDTELYSFFDREDISAFYTDNYKYCIHEPGPEDVDGFSNQVINIKGGKGKITESLFLFDSHSYLDDDKFGMRWHYDKIHDNQLSWYKSTLEELKKENGGEIKSLAFLHIPPTEMREAWNTYAENGYKDTDNIKLVSGFAGGSGKMVYCPVVEDDFIETLQECGSTQGVFFGHDHRNSMSFDYNGIRLTYGMSIDYLAIPGIWKIGRQRGCSVITVAPDGSFDVTPENYYQDKYASVYEKEVVEMQTAVNEAE